jgi:ABC-2 type transport system ATP-binding protein
MSLDIEVRDLQLRYGEVRALDGLTCSLAGGRIYGLLGRNGSGKTSLLSVLAGFRRPTAGSVLVGGQPVFENGRITSLICLIGESGVIADDGDTVQDVLEVAARLRPSWDEPYAAELVERFGLTPREKVGQLSRGQRSALGIVVGLAARAPVTLFDESHLGMDVPSRQAFQDELLADVMRHPRTLVVSTHLVDELSGLFEQVLIIDRGRLLVQDDTEALRARGVAVTGPAHAVDGFVDGLTVLGERQLGRTKSATVYGALDDGRRRQAREAGLDLGAIALQDLFVHLTEPSGGSR